MCCHIVPAAAALDYHKQKDEDNSIKSEGGKDKKKKGE